MNDHPTVHALGAALEAWHSLLDQVSAVELTLATPNPGWDVAHVINHSIAVTSKFTTFAVGTTDQPRTPDHDLIGNDHRFAFGKTAERALAAWRAADPRRCCHLPFGTFTADLAAGINLFDLQAHGWDIHQATGATFACPHTTWETGLDAARRVIGQQRDPHHFAPALPAQPSASTQIRLLRYLGRDAETDTHPARPRPADRRKQDPTNR